MNINSITPFKGKDEMLIRIDDIGQAEYDGMASFQILRGGIPSKKTYNAHYDAIPETKPPYKQGDIVSGDLYINSLGDVKKLREIKDLHITPKSLYSNTVKSIMKIMEMVSDREISGKTNDIPEGISVYFSSPVSDIKEGDVIEFEGDLEVDFD